MAHVSREPTEKALRVDRRPGEFRQYDSFPDRLLNFHAYSGIATQ